MQNRQLEQLASTSPARRMSSLPRHSAEPKSTRRAVRGSIPRQRSARAPHPGIGRGAEVTDIRPRVRVDDQPQHGLSEHPGVFYEAQEVAARRIAHRLHDESAQMLATAYLGLADIARDCPLDTVRKIDRVVEQLDGVREQLRELSHELCPPILEQLGLLPALESLADCVRQRTGLKLVVFGHVPELPRPTETVLYRVVQEALSNVGRHAQATRADVRLDIVDNRVRCMVTDDGTGLKRSGRHQGADNGLGLIGIHERVFALGGQCRIASRAGRGTKLMVEIPL